MSTNAILKTQYQRNHIVAESAFFPVIAQWQIAHLCSLLQWPHSLRHSLAKFSAIAGSYSTYVAQDG